MSRKEPEQPLGMLEDDNDQFNGPIAPMISRNFNYHFKVIKLIEDSLQEDKEALFEFQNKDFSGSELYESFNLSQRDLRNLVVDVSTIEPRRNCTIVSIERLNCIITPDSLYIHTTLEPEQTSKSFEDSFKAYYRDVSTLEANTVFRSCWEMKAFECILLFIMNGFIKRYKQILGDVKKHTTLSKPSDNPYYVDSSTEGSTLERLTVKEKESMNILQPSLSAKYLPSSEETDFSDQSFDELEGEEGHKRCHHCRKVKQERFKIKEAMTKMKSLVRLRQDLNSLITDISKVHDAIDELLDEPEDIAAIIFENNKFSVNTKHTYANSMIFNHILGNDDIFEERFINYGMGNRATPISAISHQPESDTQGIGLDHIVDFFEFYLFQLTALRLESNEVRTTIGYQLESTRMLLDEKRNKLLKIELYMSSFTVALALGSCISAMFGMNLENLMEESSVAFYVVFGITIVLCVATIFGYLSLFKKYNFDDS